MRPIGYGVELVYYMGVGNRCKIGYTQSLLERVRAVRPEELLAVEPGGYELETDRHAQFEALRTRWEWFRYEDELVAHVAKLGQVDAEFTEQIAHYVTERCPGPNRSRQASDQALVIALELREQGLTYAEIATTIGPDGRPLYNSRQCAQQHISRALRRRELDL